MPRSDRAQAIDAAFDALAETGIKWRGWGLRTIIQRAVKAMEVAGYQIVLRRHNDGPKRPPELSSEERKKRADQRDRGVLNDGADNG